MRTRPSVKNFTLLELIIATAIFAIVMISVALCLDSLQGTWRRMRQHSVRLAEFHDLERVFDSAIRNAVPFTWPSPLESNAEKPIFVGDKDRVSFAYLHRVAAPGEGALRFLTLRLEEDKLVAIYRKTPLTPWESDGAGTEQETLASGIAQISFVYGELHKDGIHWLQDWDEQNSTLFPSAISINIEWKNGDKESWLRRTAGRSLRENYGPKQEAKD